MDTGRILLFTGKGKGKTTAALGTALRASGHGMKTLIIQFVKNDSATGEIEGSKGIPTIRIVQAGRGFVPDPSSPEFRMHCSAAEEGLALARDAIRGRACDILILDEICTAAARGLLEEKDIVDTVRRAPPEVCVIMTGRGATAGLIALADTVTEMNEVKHGLAQGWKAQRGIEY
ncbi:MAG: Cob(I)yrinic acid a,c-diamide adenosyltransferase [Syntrophaceae bacterium PtaU1.Bin231]|nr:MAG: Cob(I)yrinic acid a,c-diamide adenosyltransferase [Syntrophaceae bacterium PtaU1.Bin231]